jgi:hypothetical protein
MKEYKNKIFLCLTLLAVFSFSFFINPKSTLAACSVQSATFSPANTMPSGWYKDKNKPDVTVDIVTKECQGKTIEVSIVEQDTGILNDDDLSDSGLDNKPIVVPISNHIIMHLKAGEEACENGPGDDCHYYIQISKLDTVDYKSEGLPRGNLLYECDGGNDTLITKCLENWVVGNIERPGGDVVAAPVCKDPEVLKDGKCVPLDPKYYLLAPLPCEGGSGCDPATKTLTYYDPTQNNNLSPYLNMMIRLFIGICSVLAVIMIVLGGIEYMTSELPGNKEHGKERILGAIFGLVLALGAWTLLNQINPDLLNADLKNLTSVNVDVEFSEGAETVGDPKDICGKQVTVNGQTLTSCDDSEIVTINFLGIQGIRVNKAIVGDLSTINDAWAKSTDPAVRNYKIRSIGSYNPRSATNNPKSPSGHSYGIALDINEGSNPIIQGTATCPTDMPAAFVKLFTDHGFGWGGYWHTKKDAMHFSKLPNESGYTSGSCAGLK